MSQIKAIIADDEKELRTYLKAQLADVWNDLIICGEAKNGPEALNLVDTYQPDIAFLDIRMPGFSGMEVAEKVADRCRIVFVTAHDQYAIKAFENEAVDYILKPVTRDRLKITVTRLKEQIEVSSVPPSDLPAIIERLMAELKANQKTDYLQWIRVSSRDGIRLIPTDEISYFKASDKYTLVVTGDGESLIKKPIKELYRELNPDVFWQIHRGTLVNVNFIDKVSRSLSGRLVLKLKSPPETLTVSRTYKHLFKQM